MADESDDDFVDVDNDVTFIADAALQAEVETVLAPDDDDDELEMLDADEIIPSDDVDPDAEVEPDEIVETGPIEQKTEFAPIVMRTRIRPEDSRQPDCPTIFEITAMIASRACALANNSPPLIPTTVSDPAQIARDELAAGKSLRSVLRNDVEWKWSDFAYFPLGIMTAHETTARYYEVT